MPVKSKTGTKSAQKGTKSEIKPAPKKVSATPKSISQKDYDALQKQLTDAQGKLEILDQNYAELKSEAQENAAAYRKQIAERDTIIASMETNKTVGKRIDDLTDHVESIAKNIGGKAQNTIDDIGDTAGKVNDFSKRLAQHKWVAAILLLLMVASIGYNAFLLHSENQKDKIIAQKDAAIIQLQMDLAAEKKGNGYDKTHEGNNGLPRTDTAAVKRNFQGAKR